MPPRYSRGVARPRTLWTAVFFGTVLATVLTVSHVFMTVRNMARLQELLPAPRDYCTFLSISSLFCSPGP